MPAKPIILNKTTLSKSRLFRIESLDIEFSNGERRNYERLARSNSDTSAVLIVPLLDNDC
jgi:ADP-ribose diphosphatase